MSPAQAGRRPGSVGGTGSTLTSLHPWAGDDALRCAGVVRELAQEPSSVLCSALLSVQGVPPVRNRTWITVFTGLGFSPPTR
jgi:hypothetical protein